MSRDQKPVGVLYSNGSSRERRGILYYLSYAAGLHALFFGLTAMARKEPPEVRPSSLTVLTVEQPVLMEPPPLEVQPALAEPPPVEEKPVVEEPVKANTRESPLPSPSSADQRVAGESMVSKLPSASLPTDEAQGIEKELDELGSSTSVRPPRDPQRSVNQPDEAAGTSPTPRLPEAFRPRPRGNLDTRDGSEIGENGPRGVARWGKRPSGPPHISGRTIWGEAGKQALKGTLCFLSPGTRSLVAVKRCVAAGTFYTNSLNIPKRPFTQGFPGISDRFEWFAIDYNGKFTVRQSGKYVFRVASDDGSMVWVDDGLLLNNDGLHPVQSRANAIFLSEGSHRLRLLYYQGPRVDVALQLFVTPPGGTERLWGPEL
ncbi:MAG: PA14 domain-containing protein [Polyangiaceae bacterium]|nr:PA14 domain-containing protein [Polyangiaceae bacterium]